MIGFLNINKPSGITSFGVVAKVRKKFNIKKVGHMGTLDPAGKGVLPIAVGKATKLFSYMQENEHRKCYRAVFCFNNETDTLDAEGKVVKSKEIEITNEMIQQKLPLFIGKISQMPPIYSAKKINGKRAYDLAREGKEVLLKTKEIEVYRFEIIKQIEYNKFLFEIEVSSGTYIRSLCRDLAYSLNTYAHMSCIERLQFDNFTITNAISLEQMQNAQKLEDVLITIDKVLAFEKINLNEENYFKVRNGREISYDIIDGRYYALYEDKIFSVVLVKDKKMKMEIYLDD